MRLAGRVADLRLQIAAALLADPGRAAGLRAPGGGWDAAALDGMVWAEIRARLEGMLAGRPVSPRLGHALGLAYEQVLARPLAVTAAGQPELSGPARVRRATGAFYTPWPLARFVVAATLGPLSGRSPLTVLDPAAGAGTFLLAAGAAAPGARLHGADTDGRAADMARLALRLAGLDGRIAPGNALAWPLPGLPAPPEENGFAPLDWPAVLPGLFGPDGAPAVDAVVGNPPYFSCQHLPPAVQGWLRARWPDVYSGQNDVLYYFIRLGAGLLRPGGRLGYVVARYFPDSAHARRLRRWILDHCAVEQWVDFQNVQIFPGADVLTAALVLRREPDAAARAAQPVRVVRVREWADSPARLLAHLRALDGAPAHRDRWVDIYQRCQGDWDEGPWDLGTPQAARIRAAAAGPGTVPLGELCRIGQGMKSGLNRVFVIPAAAAEAAGIEPELLRPYVKTRDLHRYHYTWRGLYLLDVRNDTPLAQYPGARRYLEQHRAALEARFQARTGACRWWALSIAQNAALFDVRGDKLLTANYARSSRFALDSGRGIYTLTDTYVVAPRPAAPVSACYLLGLLNSRAGEYLHRQAAKLKRDGYYEYVAGSLARFPVPLPAADPGAAADLTAAVQGIIAAHAGGRPGGPPDSAARRVADLERQVDAAAYRLYRLGPGEVAEVEAGPAR